MHKIRLADHLEIYCYLKEVSGHTAMMLEITLEALKPLIGVDGRKFKVYQSETSTTVVGIEMAVQLCFDIDLESEFTIYHGKSSCHPYSAIGIQWYDDLVGYDAADPELFEKIAETLKTHLW